MLLEKNVFALMLMVIFSTVVPSVADDHSGVQDSNTRRPEASNSSYSSNLEIAFPQSYDEKSDRLLCVSWSNATKQCDKVGGGHYRLPTYSEMEKLFNASPETKAYLLPKIQRCNHARLWSSDQKPGWKTDYEMFTLQGPVERVHAHDNYWHASAAAICVREKK